MHFLKCLLTPLTKTPLPSEVTMAHLSRKDSVLCRLWNELTTDNPNKSTDWCEKQTLELYKAIFPEGATITELRDALEARANQ